MNEPNSGTFCLRLSNGQTLTLNSGSTLSASDLPGLHSVPPGGPVAAVSAHPTDPNIQGLRNLSQTSWRVDLPRGDSIEVKPGKNVRLATGTRINFGPIQGEIGHSLKKLKRVVWIPLAASALCAAIIAAWYFVHRPAISVSAQSGSTTGAQAETQKSFMSLLTGRGQAGDLNGPRLKIGVGYKIEKGQHKTLTAERYGFIDTTGKTVVEPKWDAVADFRDGLASVARGGKYGFIDKRGRIVLDLQWEAAESFSDGLASVKQNGKWGVIDKTGHFTVQPQWDEAPHFADGLAFVKRDGKYGLIDKTGRMLAEPEWEEKPFFSYEIGKSGLLDNGVGIIKKGGKYGLIDKTGRTLAEPQSEEKPYFSDGIASIKLVGKYGFIDKTGKVLSDPQWDEAGRFSEEMARVQQNKKWGFIDKTGNVVIRPQWEHAGDFHDGLANVEVSSTADSKSHSIHGFIDKTGRFAIEPKWDSADDFQEGLAKVGRRKKDGWGEEYGFVDKTGRIVIEPKWDGAGSFSGGLAKIEQAGSYGIIDNTGRVVIEPQWQQISVNAKEELISVGQHGKHGFIDKTGRIVIQPEWQSIYSFSDGVAEVQRNRRYGLIDKTGRVVIEPRWEAKSYSKEAKDLPLYRLFARREGDKVIVMWTDSSGKQIWSAGEEAAGARPAKTLNVPGDYATIQKAVEAAKPGDTIIVGPGVYNEAVEVFTDNITLRGTDRDRCVIRLGANDSKKAVACLSVKDCRSVQVANLTFDRLIAPAGSRAVMLDADDVRMSACTVRSGGHGISVGYNGESATFSDCLIENCGEDGLKIQGSYSSDPGTGPHVVVTHSVFRSNKGDGLSAIGCQLEVEGTNCEGSGKNGIVVDKAIIKLNANKCRENGKAGIQLGDLGEVTGDIVDNICESNGGDGISVRRNASAAVISRNHCSQNSGFGIKNERSDDKGVAGDNILQGNRAGQMYIGTAGSDFGGVWVTDGSIEGYTKPGGKLFRTGTQIGSWRTKLVITPGANAVFTEEVTFDLGAGNTWEDVPAPHNRTRQVYKKYVTEGTRFTTTDSVLSISWMRDRHLADWRPKDFPVKDYLNTNEHHPPWKVRLVSKDELSVEDCFKYDEKDRQCIFHREH